MSENAEELYYIQDTRSYVGNDVLWWGKNSNGYTTDLSKAGLYTREEAIRKNQNRYTDVPWPKEYIDARTRPAVDCQYIHKNEAFDISGIKLQKPPKIRKERIRCSGCGVFISKESMYTERCSRCGADNLP